MADIESRVRGYELQFSANGGRWTSLTNGPETEPEARARLVRDAAQDFDARDTDEDGVIEWRIIRVIEEVVEPARTSEGVVHWACER